MRWRPDRVTARITIVASVALNAQSGANIATVSGGGDTTPTDSPPDNYIVLGTPRLAITKSHEGDFFVGQQGATYTVSVSNVGTGAHVRRSHRRGSRAAAA